MYNEIMRWISLSIWLASWVTITIVTAIRMKRFRDNTAAKYFLFACISCILSNIYWFVHTIMRPDSRIPFAANEIAENAIFLLLASCLIKLFNGKPPRTSVVINVSVFAAANTALWIAWTGEYIKDIMCGACFGYFLCITAGAVDNTELLSKRQKAFFFVSSWSVIALQSITLFTRSHLKDIADTVCYFLMAAVIIVWFAVTRAEIRRQNADKSTAAAMMLFAWCDIVMYLSAEPMYFGAMLCSAAGIVLVLMSLLITEDER